MHAHELTDAKVMTLLGAYGPRIVPDGPAFMVIKGSAIPEALGRNEVGGPLEWMPVPCGSLFATEALAAQALKIVNT